MLDFILDMMNISNVIQKFISITPFQHSKPVFQPSNYKVPVVRLDKN